MEELPYLFVGNCRWILARYQKITLDLDKKWPASKKTSKEIKRVSVPGLGPQIVMDRIEKPLIEKVPGRLRV